jgi:hypothetical protein
MQFINYCCVILLYIHYVNCWVLTVCVKKCFEMYQRHVHCTYISAYPFIVHTHWPRHASWLKFLKWYLLKYHDFSNWTHHACERGLYIRMPFEIFYGTTFDAFSVNGPLHDHMCHLNIMCLLYIRWSSKLCVLNVLPYLLEL